MLPVARKMMPMDADHHPISDAAEAADDAVEDVRRRRVLRTRRQRGRDQNGQSHDAGTFHRCAENHMVIKLFYSATRLRVAFPTDQRL